MECKCKLKRMRKTEQSIDQYNINKLMVYQSTQMEDIVKTY